MRSWTRPDGDVDYLLLANVDDDIRAAAFAGRDFACAHLGVEMPPLLFYSAEGPSEKAYRRLYKMGFKGVPQTGISHQLSHSIGVRVEQARGSGEGSFVRAPHGRCRPPALGPVPVRAGKEGGLGGLRDALSMSAAATGVANQRAG
jgi:hypothetical protein